MADDTLEIIERLDFHPCNTPKGCQYYFPNILTAEQQTRLNKLKTNTIRDDEKYLARHPEVRAIVSLVIQHVLKTKPRKNIHHTIANFFRRSRSDIQLEIDDYLKIRNVPVPEEEHVQEEEDENEIIAFYKKYCAAGVSVEEEGDDAKDYEALLNLEQEKTEAFIRNMLLEQIDKLDSVHDIILSTYSLRKSGIAFSDDTDMVNTDATDV